MLENHFPFLKDKRRLWKILILVNIVLAFHIVYRFNETIEENRREKLRDLKMDHLEVLGFYLLDYYKNCGELPAQLETPSNLQKCLNRKIQSRNITDGYNKPLFYRRFDHGAILTRHANTSFFKTTMGIERSAIVVDTHLMKVKKVMLHNGSVENCCRWFTLDSL